MINQDKENFLDKCKKNPDFVQKIIDDFTKLYYYSSALGGTWKDTYWRGIPIQKNPMDLIIYQELIVRIKPDIIIETGTKVGGSALFFADLCHLMRQGEVMTIDINKIDRLPQDNRITYLTGNSISDDIIDFISQRIINRNKKVLVILDSDHNKNHVLKELEIYSNFVSVGSYLIVEDTIINKNPVVGLFEEGPFEAIEAFMRQTSNFKIDRYCEKFYFTFNRCGYLIRTK